MKRRRRLADHCPHCDRRLPPRGPSPGETFGTGLYNFIHVVLLVSLAIGAVLSAGG